MNARGLGCAEAEALVPELALGTVDGADRAAVLAHLARCTRCREVADQLAGVADGLLLLAPRAEPPPGFETRVLDRIGAPAGAERPRRARGRARRGMVGVAAVALVAALAGGGLALLADPDKAGGDLHTALAVDDEGRWTCRAVAYGTDPTWLFVALDRRDGANRSFTVEARRVGDATPISLGSLTLHDGHGSLATLLQVPAPELHSIRMLDDTGRVRYEAEFRPAS
ncbi:MAG TPA: zf-HC2 domain-containing protein [Acidimicrobiales bacterium]|nr:zf-HC2 domain-containing protein [Acidimicrobiales bacterium]